MALCWSTFSIRWPEPQVGQIHTKKWSKNSSIKTWTMWGVPLGYWKLSSPDGSHAQMHLMHRCINSDPQLRSYANEIVDRVQLWDKFTVSYLLCPLTGNAEINWNRQTRKESWLMWGRKNIVSFNNTKVKTHHFGRSSNWKDVRNWSTKSSPSNNYS